MTEQTLRGVSGGGPLRAEPGTVRVHTPSDRRVTGQTVALGMAGRATLQRLPRGTTVLEQPLGLRVMEGDVQPAPRAESGFAMAAAAEQLRVVARGALRFAPVGIGGMPLHEVRLVETA